MDMYEFSQERMSIMIYTLPAATPESQGVPSAALQRFLQAVHDQNIELHSLVFLRHSQVIAQGAWSPYSLDRNHMLFSLSKSFTSTAVGFAVQEGLLSVDDPVLKHLPEYAKGLSRKWQALKVRHLLSMSTGHIVDPSDKTFGRRGGDWVKGFFSVPLEKEPGTHFVYNTAATYLLSVIVHRLAGMRILDYLTPRLFAPLGIQGATWEQCPRGYDTGGFGLMIKTHDIAKFGQFLLQRGAWQGKQLLNAAWIDEATGKHVSNGPADGTSDWGQGYGYQFWRCIPEGVYRGDGAFGQYCVVSPGHDAVFAINSGIGDMQAMLTLLWQHVLPAMADTLPEDPAAHQALQDALAGLRYDPPKAQPNSALETKWNGKTILLDKNPMHVRSLTLRFDEGCCELTTAVTRRYYGTLSSNANRGGRTTLVYGRQRWVQGEDASTEHPHVQAASFTWEDGNTLRLTARDVNAPFVTDLRLVFDGDEVLVQHKINVSFGSAEAAPVKGRSKENNHG